MRVGHIDGEFILYPTFTQLKESDLDLVVSSTREKVIMVEAGGNSVPEDVFVDAVDFAHEANQKRHRGPGRDGEGAWPGQDRASKSRTLDAEGPGRR